MEAPREEVARRRTGIRDEGQNAPRAASRSAASSLKTVPSPFRARAVVLEPSPTPPDYSQCADRPDGIGSLTLDLDESGRRCVGGRTRHAVTYRSNRTRRASEDDEN